MGEVAHLPSDWKWVMTSAFLHAGVVAFFALRVIPFARPIPIGVDIKYGGEIEAELRKASPPSSAASSMRKEDGDVTVKTSQRRPQPKPASVSPASATSKPIGRQDGVAASELEHYLYELEQFLQSRLVYPQAAKRLHQVGTVVVSFRVAADGSIGEAAIMEPCASGVLNQAAQDLVNRAGKFKPLPSELKNAGRFEVPIRYRL